MPLPIVDDYGLPIGTPDEQAQREAAMLALRTTGNAAASIPLTLAAPDPKLPGPLGYVPGAGAVEGIGGLLGDVWDSSATLANAAGRRWGLSVPGAPKLLSDMQQRFEENRGEVKTGLEKYTGGLLKQPDMSTSEGNVADIIGGGIGGGIGYLPEAVASTVARYAPYGLKTAASFLAPAVSNTARNVPVTSVLGAGAVGLEAATNPALAAPHAPVADTQQTQQPPATPTIEAEVTTPKPVQLAENKGFSLSDVPGYHDVLGMPKPSGWQDEMHQAISGAPSTEPVGPTFGQQGYGDLEVWHALGALALTIAGIGAGKWAHGRMGGEITQAGRDARFNDPAYAQQAQDYNNSVIARGSGQISPPVGEKAPVAPLPMSNVAGRVGTRVAEGTVNEAAQVQQYLNLSADNPYDGQRMAHQFGNMHDMQFVTNKLTQFLETGHDRDSGVHITAPAQAYEAYSRLNPDQVKLYNDGLMAEGELQHRSNNGGRVHDFPGASDTALGQHVSNARADPQVYEAMQRYKEVVSGMLDIGEARKFFAPNEAANLRTLYGNSVPEVDIDGRLVHPYSGRTQSAYTGTAEARSQPINNLAQHVEELHKLFALNDLNRMLRDQQMSVQRQYPQSAQFMTDVTSPTGPHASYYGSGVGNTFGTARDPVVIVRDGNGVHHVRVDQPDVYRAMTSNGMLSARVRLGAAATVRRAYQKGTTGLVSGITGRLYPPVAAAYTTLQMGTNAPRQAYGGILDRFVQRNLPGTVASRLSPVARGLDMAGPNQLGTAYSYARGVGDRWINRLADVFHKDSEHIANKYLRSIQSPAWVDSLSDGMKQRYLNSTTHFIDAEGAGGQGSPLHMDMPGLTTKGDTGVKLASARVVPKAFFKGDWMGAKPYVMDVEKTLGEASSHIADAGHDYFLRLNRDNPNLSKESLIYETRNLTGNPTRQGGSSLMQGASQLLPYLNISAQGVARYGRAFGDRPVGTPVALATGLSMYAIASLLTHMRSKEHMDYMQNQLSLQQREANVVLALHSDPTKGTFFKLPQELRSAYAFALDFWSKAINYVGARHDQGVFNNLWDGLKEFLGQHITNSNEDAIIHGLVDVGDVVNLPPWMGRVDWNSVIHGKSVIDSYSNIRNYHNPPPGQGIDAPLDSKQGSIFHDILANTIGAVADVLTPANSAVRYYNQGHPFWESMGMAGHDWLFGASGANPQLNVLMETPVRLSTNPPIVEALRPQLGWFKGLPSNPNDARLGWTGPGPSRQPIPDTIDRPVSNDPVMQQMLRVAHGYGTRIDQALEPIKAIQTQMASVDKLGMDPKTKREWMNQRTRDIADKYRFVESIVGDAQYALSKLAGKTVTLGPKSNIDWQKDSSQFRQWK